VHQISESDLRNHHACNYSDHFPDDNDSIGVSDTDDSSNADDDEGETIKQTKKKRRGPSEVVAPLVPALLAVCKQINTEGRDLLYGNHFYFTDPLALHSFMVDIGPGPALHLKHISLVNWSDGRGHRSYNHTCFTALMTATNLESFNTHGHPSGGNTPKLIATQIYRDAFPWLEAVGREKGKIDAAVDIFHIRCAGYYRGGYDHMDEFRAELRKLLNARMDRIRR
jgi:hypothetical protein